jgi:hypothetical protein
LSDREERIQQPRPYLPDDHGAIVQGRVDKENRHNDIAAKIAVNAHAAAHKVLQTRRALEHNQCAVMALLQPLYGIDE